MSTPLLKGVTVLEFSQYLSGPSAGLRLADLGARVIKIEKPGSGDACRQLSIKNLWADDNTLLFHTINRDKESIVADLKSPDDLYLVKQLIRKADVITHNFRPGVMERAGLDYESVKEINPRIVYAEISGYGKTGPWRDKPGQDLLLQAMSGLTYTTGNEGENPVPFGIAIADIICGSQMTQAILGALIRLQKKGVGAHIELSLMESLLDFQFELLTTFYAKGEVTKRSAVSNGNPLLSAPYGIYQTEDGFLAIAMMPLQKLADVIDCSDLLQFSEEEAFSKRDEIKLALSNHLQKQTTQYWLLKLQAADIWAMEVLDWKQLMTKEGYRQLEMEQKLLLQNGKEIVTTRCPIRINGQRLLSQKPAPQLGEHTEQISKELASLAAVKS